MKSDGLPIAADPFMKQLGRNTFSRWKDTKKIVLRQRPEESSLEQISLTSQSKDNRSSRDRENGRNGASNKVQLLRN